MSDTKKRTELHELGRYRLLERLSEGLDPCNRTTAMGLGHDASAMAPTKRRVVMASGLMLEGIHFNLTYFPLKHLGYKSLIAQLGRIYAMNAEPQQAQVALGVSGRFGVEELEELVGGVRLAASRYGVDLVGLDVSSSYTGLTVGVGAQGQCDARELVGRSGAREHQLLCVTGALGAAYMGQQLLERERRVFEANPYAQPQLEGHSYLLERILKPELRGCVAVLAELRQRGLRPTAMTLVNEGLASALLHICQRSGVGCRVYADRIPVDAHAAALAEELRIDPLTAAMNGGEDYELLFSVPVKAHQEVASVEGVSVVGHLTDAGAGAYMVPPHGDELRITAQGWNAIVPGGAD
ncbi:MAG: thiamine-phosphate kinase [Bacteroidales bacterium]|nr:thiamine-phosphate kinase [Bacteroidales bacterium]